MLELISSLGLVSGIVLFNKIHWKGTLDKRLYSLFWISLIGLLLVGLLSSLISELIVFRILLSITLFCSLLVLTLRVKFNSLNSIYKMVALILYISNFSFFIYLLWSLIIT